MFCFDAGGQFQASIAEAGGAAFEGDDVGVVNDAVDHRRGHD